MPPGTDAIVPADQAEPDGSGHIELIEPVAVGANVDRRGAVAEAGAILVVAGNLSDAETSWPRRFSRLHWHIRGPPPAGAPGDRRPASVRCKRRQPADASRADRARWWSRYRGQPRRGIWLRRRHRRPSRDRRRDEQLAAAMASAGSLDIDGVALIPGETAGFGRTADGTPAVLLPAAPAGCLWNYELFAGRAIRRLGGRQPALPYDPRQVTTARKIVSPIGMTEICPIRSSFRWSGRTKRVLCRDRVESSRCGRRICYRPCTERGVSGRSLGQRLFL